MPFGGSIVLDKLTLTATTHFKRVLFLHRHDWANLTVSFSVELWDREEHEAGQVNTGKNALPYFLTSRSQYFPNCSFLLPSFPAAVEASLTLADGCGLCFLFTSAAMSSISTGPGPSWRSCTADERWLFSEPSWGGTLDSMGNGIWGNILGKQSRSKWALLMLCCWQSSQCFWGISEAPLPRFLEQTCIPACLWTTALGM